MARKQEFRCSPDFLTLSLRWDFQRQNEVYPANLTSLAVKSTDEKTALKQNSPDGFGLQEKLNAGFHSHAFSGHENGSKADQPIAFY